MKDEGKGRRSTESRKKEVRNVQDFLEWVVEVRGDFDFDKGVQKGEPYREESDAWQPWFRGHEKSCWHLIPKLQRKDRYGVARRIRENLPLNVEDEIVEEFMVRAVALSDIVPDKDDVWGWWFLMQHFNVPTRLLDWTEGALTALYFAVKGDSDQGGAMVWALDPYELNRRSLGFGRDWVPNPCSPGNSDDEATRLRPWLPRKLRRESLTVGPELPAKVIAVSPSYAASRMSTQRSCFTVHGARPEDLDCPADDPKPYLKRVTVPAECVVPIRKELDACGIDEATVFPDLDHLGTALQLKWQEFEPRDQKYPKPAD
jgi:hypothetical protein